MKKLASALVFCLCLSGVAQNAVTYKHGETELEGYLAVPAEKKASYPVVLVVHQWMGLGDYEKGRADQLAKMGYLAFAVDIYGKGVRAKDAGEARKLATLYRKDRKLMRDRINTALDFIKKDTRADSKRIAAIGYCFGGGIVLNMARQGVDLKGVASFHGPVATKSPAKEGDVKAKVRVYNGAADPFVKKEQLEAFEEEMKNAGVDYQVISYEGAKHSFTNKGADENGKKFGLPLEYNKAADEQSWAAMQTFFKGLF